MSWNPFSRVNHVTSRLSARPLWMSLSFRFRYSHSFRFGCPYSANCSVKQRWLRSFHVGKCLLLCSRYHCSAGVGQRGAMAEEQKNYSLPSEADSFLFTSESVGEGHPGMQRSVALRYSPTHTWSILSLFYVAWLQLHKICARETICRRAFSFPSGCCVPFWSKFHKHTRSVKQHPVNRSNSASSSVVCVTVSLFTILHPPLEYAVATCIQTICSTFLSCSHTTFWTGC